MARSQGAAILSGMLTNALAAVSPGLYMRLTGETGRGRAPEDSEALAAYCERVVDDYRRVLAAAGLDLRATLHGATVAEYGPGDFLGVALLLLLQGARKVYCIDRFALRNDAPYRGAYEKLRRRDEQGQRSTGGWERLLDEGVTYVAEKDGVCELPERADLVVSRAVLEHVNDLPATFRNMRENLADGGVMAHKVDLTSHGTHRKTPMDFLCYSQTAWRLMTSRKGFPNRHRRPVYRDLLRANGLSVAHEESQFGFEKEELTELRSQLAFEFRGLCDEELLCSDYFFVARKA